MLWILWDFQWLHGIFTVIHGPNGHGDTVCHCGSCHHVFALHCYYMLGPCVRSGCHIVPGYWFALHCGHSLSCVALWLFVCIIFLLSNHLTNVPCVLIQTTLVSFGLLHKILHFFTGHLSLTHLLVCFHISPCVVVESFGSVAW